MKQIQWIILLLLTAWTATWAQETASAETAKDTVSNKSLLWEITGNDLEKPSYLFGTIHMIGKEDYIFNEVMQEAFDEAERVTFEIKLDDMMDMSSQMSLMMKAFMNDGKTLQDLLSEEEYSLVETHFEKMGLPLVFLERLKPMFLSALAGGEADPTAIQSGEMVSYELELMREAQAVEKEIMGLETAEFQMSMFDSIPYDAQAKMLVESIKSTKQGNDEFQRMVDMYKDQDIEGMQTMMDEDPEGIGKYEELLLVKRNKNWIPVMAEQMVEKPTFFAVGAGHLGGEFGVIKLLKEEGYSVKPIR